MKSSPDGVREHLIASIRGSSVVIPDLAKLMSHWPAHVNPHIDKLDAKVHEILEAILTRPEDARRLQIMKKSKFALFAASWWPFASLEALLTTTHLVIWLFLWDDETDSHEFSSIFDNFEQSCDFRKETLAYLRASLSQQRAAEPSQVSNNPIIANFQPVADAITKSYTNDQTQVFFEELQLYIEMTEEEHRLQTTNQLPSPSEYMRRRMGSSAVRVCLAIQEYTLSIEVPIEAMRSDLMQAIWNETNIIISVSNDILSIKKEIDQSQVDTLIPVLFLQGGSLQDAVDQATNMVRAAVERFDAAEKSMHECFAASPETLESVRRFIDNCKHGCTANFNWSMSSGRYKLPSLSKTGNMEIDL
ncbi:isoprenoid synthase domain-containing protein [Hypoxylon cercidicola]|nr:isoprenoid synthase domain-containing protein [Hypoxylon cercidicola]